MSTIKQGGSKLLKDVKLFDYYVGDKIESNKISLAFNLYFESSEKTLSDEEILPLFNKIIAKIVCKCTPLFLFYQLTLKNTSAYFKFIP